MLVEICRSPIPIAWIDTSILIKMAKVRAGEAIGEPDETRARDLFQAMRRLVVDRRLVCPEGDQREEYEEGRRLIPVIQEVQADLSVGVSFQHRQAIRDHQTWRGMQAFHGAEERLVLDYRDAFCADPVEEMKKKFHVIARFPTPEEWIASHTESTDAIRAEWEQLRLETVAQRRTFEEQLERERNGILLAYLGQLAEMRQRVQLGRGLTLEDFNACQGIGTYLALWERVGGQPLGLEGLIRFLTSSQFYDLPFLDTQSRLAARLMTSLEPIERGDSMDLACVGSVFPYSDLIVTDRKMRDRMRDLGLGEKYGVTVFSMQSHDEIMAWLHTLE